MDKSPDGGPSLSVNAINSGLVLDNSANLSY